MNEKSVICIHSVVLIFASFVTCGMFTILEHVFFYNLTKIGLFFSDFKQIFNILRKDKPLLIPREEIHFSIAISTDK